MFDLRDEATFAEAHPLFAASLPLERIELEMLDRVPRQSTTVVVYDDGEGLGEGGRISPSRAGIHGCRHARRRV